MTTTDDTAVAVDEDPTRPLRKDAARNRDALIAAGRLVFAERGLDASLDDVARRAGVGVGTAYRRFANKFELARAIFVQSIDDVIALAEEAETAERAWDGIARLIAGSAEAQAADRGLREILMGFHDDEQFEHVADRMWPPVERLIARGQAEGDVRADVRPSDLWAVLTMLFTVADLAPEQSPELWRRYLPALLDGLRPGVEPPVPALGSDAVRAAVRSHKQRLARGLPC